MKVTRIETNKTKGEKNFMKKLVAILMAIMMIAMVGAAWADPESMTNEAGVIGEFTTPNTPVVKDKAVKLYKEIFAFNPENSTVNAPTITYTYTITPGSANKDIYDMKSAHDPQANAHVLTKAGITTGLTINSGTAGTAASASGTVTWNPSVTADQLTASSTGTKNVKPIEIDFSNVTFTGAGVYRYKIDETVSSYVSSGVVESVSTNHTRYLDVYVKDGTTAGTYDIYGYVCFTNDNNIDAQDTPTASTPNTVAAAGKTEGFVGVDTNNDGDYSDDGETPADQYYTYNLTISKTLSGDQAMNAHDFPFKVQFANTTVTDAVLPIVTGTGDLPTLTAAPISSFAIDGTSNTATQQLKLANGETAVFTGIPAGTKATIDEYNDVAGTTYRVTTMNATENEDDGINLNWNAWASSVNGWGQTVATGTATSTVYALGGTANQNVAAEKNFTATAGQNGVVTFTNTLLQISPTGYISRFAPYALILVAGIVLLIVAKKRKPSKDEE